MILMLISFLPQHETGINITLTDAVLELGGHLSYNYGTHLIIPKIMSGNCFVVKICIYGIKVYCAYFFKLPLFCFQHRRCVLLYTSQSPHDDLLVLVISLVYKDIMEI